jgi:hypothetical protein
MTPALNHNQLRSAQGRVGNPEGRRFPAHITTDQFQNPTRCDLPRRVHSRGRSTPRAFYSIARWPLSSLSDRRLVLLLPVRAATHSSNVAHEVRRRPGASCRGAQFSLRFSGGSSHLRVPKHSACKLSDASERHSLERLSCDRVAMTNRDTPERPKSWKLKPTRTAS